jgi:hypothetical protein
MDAFPAVQGNALALQERYADAAAAYRAGLGICPTHERLLARLAALAAEEAAAAGEGSASPVAGAPCTAAR